MSDSKFAFVVFIPPPLGKPACCWKGQCIPYPSSILLPLGDQHLAERAWR